MIRSKKIEAKLQRYHRLSNQGPGGGVSSAEDALFKSMIILESKYSPFYALTEAKKAFKKSKTLFWAKMYPEKYDEDVAVFGLSESKVLSLIDKAIKSLKNPEEE